MHFIRVFWWYLISIQCWSQSEEQSSCSGMELVSPALLIPRVKGQPASPRAFLQPVGTVLQEWSLFSPWRSHSVPSPNRTHHDPYLSTSAAQHLRISSTDTLAVSCCWVENYCKWETAQPSCFHYSSLLCPKRETRSSGILPFSMVNMCIATVWHLQRHCSPA